MPNMEPGGEPEPAPLDALRRRVAKAVQVIEELRTANAALREQVRELEKRPAVNPDHAFLSLPRTPDALKSDLRSFIETLDEYIEQEHSKA